MAGWLAGRLICALGGFFARVLRVLERLGGSFVRISRVQEVPGGAWRAPDSLALTERVGPLKKDLTRAGGGEGGRERSGSFVRVLRVLEALGGSFVRVLRVREAPGGARF